MSLLLRPIWLLVFAILLGMVGCDANVDRFPANQLYGEVVAKREHVTIEPAVADVSQLLTWMFGTPDEPRLPAGFPTGLVSEENLARAAGPVSSDKQGVRFGLFRAQCVVCHGMEGGGAGPAAAAQNPYPRDFRPAIFKFKATARGAKPTREDLVQLLHRGIAGTSMPSFSRLPAEDVEALVDYVIYLSIRGETERRLLDFAVRQLGYGDVALPPDERLTLDARGEFAFPSVAESVNSLVGEIAQSWLNADQQVVPLPANVRRAADKNRPPHPTLSPADLAARGGGEEAMESHPTLSPADLVSRGGGEGAMESAAGLIAEADHGGAVERGRELFHGPLANCASCHGNEGGGDAVTLDFDDWTKEYSTRLGIAPGDAAGLKPMRAAGALRPRPVQPRNLQWGVYRGGGDAATLYRRLVAGIEGTPMPGLLIQETEGPTGITPEQVRDLVAYVQSLGAKSASGQVAGTGSQGDFRHGDRAAVVEKQWVESE